MDKTVVRNAAVVLPDRVVENSAVVCEDGRVTTVCRDEDLPAEVAAGAIDAGGALLAPGFIDLHFHGALDIRIDDGADGLTRLCRELPQFGVTSFLPGVCPRPKGEDAEFLASLAGVQAEGTQILGFHLEGPFLAMTGALPPEAIGTADPERVRLLRDAAGAYPAVFSIAPDFEGILDLIPIMAENETPVFITHTRADVAQSRAAIEAGARHATHFYDVFPYPGEKEPGVRASGAVEAVLADPRVTVDFILDGEHVDPVAVKMALQCKGPDGVSLITDANVVAGLPPGRYHYGGGEIESKYPGGPARLTEDSLYPDCLAGSGLTMDLAVRNAVKMLAVELPQAVKMAGANPARVLGVADRKGQIKEGFDADLVLLDKALVVQRTWVGGQCVFCRDE